MGSCTSSCIPRRSRRPPSATVVDTHGSGILRRVRVPVTAAELMLEKPLHVVCAVEDLRKARRVLPLRADDKLAAGKAYVLLPSARVNGRVSDKEMAAVDSAAGKRRRRCSARVGPAGTAEGDHFVKVSGSTTAAGGGLGRQRLGNCKQRDWRPVLAPITEVA